MDYYIVFIYFFLFIKIDRVSRALMSSYLPPHYVRVKRLQSVQESEPLPHSGHGSYLLLFLVTQYHVCFKAPAGPQSIWKLKTDVCIIQPQGPSSLIPILPPISDLDFCHPPSEPQFPVV